VEALRREVHCPDASGLRAWAARLGNASGQRVWAARLGGASGRRVWAAAQGSLLWERCAGMTIVGARLTSGRTDESDGPMSPGGQTDETGRTDDSGLIGPSALGAVGPMRSMSRTDR